MILETCRRLFAQGWSSVKLYFMIGLPTETDEDRAGIPALVKRIRRLGREVTGRKPAVTVAVSSFVPKPHTPFQWASQLLPGELRPIHNRLREELRACGATFKWHLPETSALEGLIARGDRRVGRVIHLAWLKGRRFDGWSEQFALAPWLEACGEAGIDFEGAIARERGIDEPLPWEHLGYPEQTAFLKEEHRLALAADALARLHPGRLRGVRHLPGAPRAPRPAPRARGCPCRRSRRPSPIACGSSSPSSGSSGTSRTWRWRGRSSGSSAAPRCRWPSRRGTRRTPRSSSARRCRSATTATRNISISRPRSRSTPRRCSPAWRPPPRRGSRCAA